MAGSPSIAAVFGARSTGSPSPSALFAQRVVVGVGDMAVSNQSSVTLSTYALGSCIGIAVYDPVAKAGGLLHIMLPEAKISPDKALTQPAALGTHTRASSDRARLRVLIAGGASVLCGSDSFKIGERNTRATLEWLARNGFAARNQITGGTVNRTLHLDINNGTLALKAPDANLTFALGA